MMDIFAGITGLFLGLKFVTQLCVFCSLAQWETGAQFGLIWSFFTFLNSACFAFTTHISAYLELYFLFQLNEFKYALINGCISNEL
jgi:hypothetical protein